MLLSLRNLRVVEWASLRFCYSSPPETAETVWTRAEATHRRWAHSGAESKRDATAWWVKPARENLQPMTQQSSELRVTVGTSRCFSNTLRQKLAPPVRWCVQPSAARKAQTRTLGRLNTRKWPNIEEPTTVMYSVWPGKIRWLERGVKALGAPSLTRGGIWDITSHLFITQSWKSSPDQPLTNLVNNEGWTDQEPEAPEVLTPPGEYLDLPKGQPGTDEASWVRGETSSWNSSSPVAVIQWPELPGPGRLGTFTDPPGHHLLYLLQLAQGGEHLLEYLDHEVIDLPSWVRLKWRLNGINQIQTWMVVTMGVTKNLETLGSEGVFVVQLHLKTSFGPGRGSSCVCAAISWG